MFDHRYDELWLNFTCSLQLGRTITPVSSNELPPRVTLEKTRRRSLEAEAEEEEFHSFTRTRLQTDSDDVQRGLDQ